MTTRAYMAKWRAANAEHLKAYRRQRYEANHEREISLCMLWQKEHPLEAAIHRKVVAANARYPGRISAQDVRDIIARDGWVCYWCKQPITNQKDFTLEHLQPTNAVEHLTLACHKCNAAKLPSCGRDRRLTAEERQQHRLATKMVYDKRWKQEHRDQENANQRARYWAHVEERRAYFREWQRKKREAIKSI